MLGIVIINFNTYKITIECINSIFKTYKKDFKIYLIDNNSSNESASILEKEYQNNNNVLFVKNKENIGFAKANNQGIHLAEKDGISKIIISNNDIIFHENAIDLLEKTLNKTNALIVAPKIINLDGQVQFSIKPKKLSFTDYWFSNSYFNHFLTKKKVKELLEIPSSLKEVYMVSGACFIVNIEKFKQIDYFDPNTFLYCEELIISEKALKKSLKLFFEPNAVVTHHHGASTSDSIKLFTKIENVKSEAYLMKNYFNYSILKIRFVISVRRLEVLYTFTKEKRFKEIKEFYHKTNEIIKHSKEK